MPSRLGVSERDTRRSLGGTADQGDLRAEGSSPSDRGHRKGSSKTRAVQGYGRSAREHGRGLPGYSQRQEALGMHWRGEGLRVAQTSGVAETLC